MRRVGGRYANFIGLGLLLALTLAAGASLYLRQAAARNRADSDPAALLAAQDRQVRDHALRAELQLRLAVFAAELAADRPADALRKTYNALTTDLDALVSRLPQEEAAAARRAMSALSEVLGSDADHARAHVRQLQQLLRVAAGPGRQGAG